MSTVRQDSRAAPGTPLVSVIVPTRNSERFLKECLTSVRSQSYSRIELLVVDNHSEDSTLEIATTLADKVLTHGPERSAQVNVGVKACTGQFILRVDADFLLSENVVSECVDQALAGFDAVVVHNTPDSSAGRLARIRKFEIDMYKYSLDHTSARFLSRDLFLDLGGLREDVIAGEDYDFQNRIRRAGLTVGFIASEAVHLAEPTRYRDALRKFFFYGRDFPNFVRHNRLESRVQLAFLRRDYLRHWRDFVSNPRLAFMFFLYHLAKFLIGGAGFLCGLISPGEQDHVAMPSS